MKIYIVTTGEYDQYWIQAVFSKRKIAEEFLKVLKDGDKRVEEIDLDLPRSQWKWDWRVHHEGKRFSIHYRVKP